MNENISLLDKQSIKNIIIDQKQSFSKKQKGITRDKLKTLKKYLNAPHTVVISGLRRAGKSTLLVQLAEYLGENSFYYLNFEDERLAGLTAKDLNYFYQILIELYGEKNIFLLDEIQNVEGWENFIRRMSDTGKKFIITGSNASLLSKELGTKLTGRYLAIELYPFSYKEFIEYKGLKLSNLIKNLTTENIAKLQSLLTDYVKVGGIPEQLEYPELPIHQNLYQDILYRDIASRYNIKDTLPLRNLSKYLISNISNLSSFNKIKDILKLGSVNTVTSYIDHLCNSWLFFTLEIYDYSVKRQQIAPKKVYTIDTGLAQSVGFSFSANYGRWMENIVFLQLSRKSGDIFYYKTQDGKETDFYLPESKELIQVTQNMNNESTYQREIGSLLASMEELNINEGLIITEELEKEIVENGKKIDILPLYKFLSLS